MSEILRNIVDESVLGHNAARIHTGLDPISPGQMPEVYNAVFDEVHLTLLGRNKPWYVKENDYVEIPDEETDEVTKLVNSVVVWVLGKL